MNAWLSWGVMSALLAGQASAATTMLCVIVRECIGRALVER